MKKSLRKRVKRRTFRVRNGLKSAGLKPRISVFRSLRYIGAQVIDDAKGITIASCSSLSMKDKKGDKKEVAKQVGVALGKLAKEKSVEVVFFDRGSNKYHGRIAALADGLRESGLKF